MKILFAILAVALFTSALSEDLVNITSTSEDTSPTSSVSSTITTSTATPIQSTEAPTKSTEAPTKSTEAPTKSTEAPTKSTEAPTVSTEAPTVSTEAPTVSTEAPTVSTEAPTVSTEAPTKSTEAPTTSTEAPIPSTETPVPEECSWNVTEGNDTCIKAEMKAQFIIDNEGKKSYINLGCNATVQNSDCSPNGTQILVLSEKEIYNLTMVFVKGSEKFSVRNITFDFTLPDGEQGFVYNDSESLFTVNLGHSYLCKSKIDVQLGNVTMKISQIHIQAFVEKDKDFGKAEECNADDVVSDMIPIAVGVVLVTLVIVVLIAYLVGRRRNQQRGYQTFQE